MDEEYELNFDEEFMTEEEIEEMLNSIVVLVGRAVDKDERRASIIDPIKLSQIHFTYKTLKYLTRGTEARVSYKLHEPYRSMGSVSVVGRDVCFEHPGWFIRMAECASNFEAYPRTDGTIQITFTFHGLTVPIE